VYIIKVCFKIVFLAVIGHFRVTLCLCLKAGLCAKPSYENEFDLHENEPVRRSSFSYGWFRPKTHFDIEIKGYYEAAY